MSNAAISGYLLIAGGLVWVFLGIIGLVRGSSTRSDDHPD